MSQGSRHRVAVLALTDVVGFDLAIPGQVMDRGEGGPYDVHLCAERPGPVSTTTGYSVVVDQGLEALATAHTVVVPGFAGDGRRPSDVVLDALSRAHGRGTRMVSICSGAFALAAAGLLDGRRATTHWSLADLLRDTYPDVLVDPDVLYTDEGDVLTSAGVAAGLDLCLHVVRRDFGAEAANRAARLTVVAAQRDGGQAQFIDRPLPESGSGLAPTRAWMLERLDRRLTLADLAGHAGWSERSFIRRFRAETGEPPLRWLTRARVAEARRLLEASDLSVDQVAQRVGFGTATTLRTHFARETRCSPAAYRRAWQGRSG